MSKLKEILSEISEVLGRFEESAAEETAFQLLGDKRIFVIGEGRSGLMAKSFAMRMMHLGATVYVIGETITPSLSGNDILVAVSGSGTTQSVVWTAQKAQEIGAFIIALTTNRESPLGKCASRLILIPAATKHRREGEQPSIQPLGSLFDQCVHLVLDSVCLSFAKLSQIDNAMALKQHSNME
ncbi:6-phospho-3-hexuloisomerase [Paenibacillus sp. 19GGS1-52]|uniref:6-phospho-3-hexuloisomerase n=1 Tax=Paenibacillus sp. 19GGS1-52 TaxID=2758563 RepID=UPI001EFA5F6F|nr:6-phospho-3-hexuloisomerase [Paenibacillus sp. 19GGS1-52]ULO07300.1 6-phospho-3-hexuloisomerase [Paenibacillus sp. 19GGS1-52]